MRRRNSLRPTADANYLSEFMHGLRQDKKRLSDIQGAYDNLTLLGQLLCAGTDITGMREDFNQLADVLLEQLAQEHHRKAVLHLGSSAQVAIDILTRNLFERTADIGFLATDREIRAFAEAVAGQPMLADDPEWHGRLHQRFDEYVRKYSVYHNIILLSPAGDVLVQLDRTSGVSHSEDPLIGEALATEAPYVEVFRQSDLLPGESSPLVYAYRVMSADGSQPVGVLCLCFRFQDECRRIFDNLVAPDDWTVITLLDARGKVLASSDPNQFPVGARLETSGGQACEITRFAGREYLAATRQTHGYQGYAVPGWVGHAVAPLNHAFEMASAHELAQVPEDFLAGVLETATLFSDEVKAIPLKAASIQGELNRAVWNGYVWLVRDPAAAQNAAFAKVLLREIGNTGIQTRNAFDQSINNLYRAVISSAMFDCENRAALAIDILDRNLYERANDCRWWGLTEAFREEMQQVRWQDKVQRGRLTDILRQINGLYTVYSNLVLFDQGGRVVAVSNPAYNDLVGQALNEPWVRPTLALTDTQSYGVSAFAPCGLYDGEHTYVFSAAVREPDGNEPIGGIAIVFDALPQFRAMLDDILPRQAGGAPVPGAFAVFAERGGRVVASTDSSLCPGMPLMIGYEFFHLAPGGSCTNIVIFNGRYYAVGSSMSAGYREYGAADDARRIELVALVFSPLSETVVDGSAIRQASLMQSVSSPAQKRRSLADSVDVACFYIGRNWYGIRSSSVIEAVDIDRLTPMPGLPDSMRGCLMYEGQAISVLDLSDKLAARPVAGERRQPQTGRRQIVVLQAGEGLGRFGLLVDQLDKVCEIPCREIEPLPEMMSDGQSLIESLVKPQSESSERRILVILSVDRILRRLEREAVGLG